MDARPFDSDAATGLSRPIVRRNPEKPDEIELVEASWGLETRDAGQPPFKFIRSEGKEFPDHRCLIPASEFHIRKGNKRYKVTLDDGNFFYLAGIWRKARHSNTLTFAVITVEANPEVSRHQDRQGAVILRRQVMGWLDHSTPDEDLLNPLPARTFRIEAMNGEKASGEPLLL